MILIDLFLRLILSSFWKALEFWEYFKQQNPVAFGWIWNLMKIITFSAYLLCVRNNAKYLTKILISSSQQPREVVTPKIQWEISYLS